MKNVMTLARRGLKFVTMIGTGVLIGYTCGLGVVAVPTILVPLKVCSVIGADILTGVVSEKTDDYIDRQMDELEQQIDEFIKDAQFRKEYGEG